MGAGDFAQGALVLAATLGSSAWIAAVVIRRRLDGLRGAPVVVAWAVLFSASVIAIHLAPALVGILSPLSVALVAILGGAAVTRLPARPRRPELARVDGDGGPAGEPRGSWLLVAASASALTGWLAVATRASLADDLRHPDVLTFHLPVVARWIQRGSIWGNDQFVPFFANGNYPQNGNVLHLAALLPFEQDAFVRFVFHPFLALVVVGVYALAREIGAARPVSWLAGMAFAAIPVVAYGTTQAGPDNLLFFGFAAGALFLLRFRRTGARAELLLAGTSLGLAFGTKWYGVTAVPALVGLWSAQHVILERRVRDALRHAAAVAGLVAVGGGIWLVRNLAFTPSPVFPAPVRPFGLTVFDAPPDPYTERYGHRIVDYAFDGRIWVDRILPDWWSALGVAPVIALGAVAVASVLLVTGRWSARGGPARSIALCCATSGLLLALYTVTPHTAYGPEGDPLLIGPNSRYGLTAVLLAVAVAAALARRLGRWGIVLELALAAAVVVGLAKAAPVPRREWAVASALLLAVALALLSRRQRLVARLAAPVPRRQLVAAGAVVLLLASIAARSFQQRQAADRYARLDPISGWIQRHAPGGSAIGIAGNFADVDAAAEPPRPIYPAFGPRLRNRVEYVGPFVDGLLRRHTEHDAFRRALERGEYDLLIVYRHGRPPRAAAEERWARGLGFRTILASRSLALLRAPAGTR